VPAAAKSPVTPSPAATVAPASGRLIWTGHLQKNQTLIIDGASASTGSFTGELPGKPIQLKIWPGDLANDGIVMYTANSQGASAVYEPPGRQNGWNKTLYTLNPRRAAEILLVEPPGPQNGWKRLVLRSKSPKASVILVEWTLAR
jgi:phosphatidylserine decarboxylase